MRRTLVLLGALSGLFLLLLTAPPGARAEPYTPTVPTTCTVGAPDVRVDERVFLNVVVSSSSNVPAAGSVDITITRRGTAARAARAVAPAVVWTRTVRYEGSPLRVRGPVLPRGQYAVAIEFTPDGGVLTGCSDTARFRVGGGGPTDPDGPDGPDDGLPNTGGPHLFFVVAGAGLVAAGGGLVGRSRRRA